MCLGYTGTSSKFFDSDVIYNCSIKATKNDRRVMEYEAISQETQKKEAIDENISQYSTADESEEINTIRLEKKQPKSMRDSSFDHKDYKKKISKFHDKKNKRSSKEMHQIIERKDLVKFDKNAFCS